MFDKRLKTFAQTASLGSFSRAAHVLSLSTPAVIKQMNSLEAQLNTPLFIRTSGKGVELTEAGKVLLTESKRLDSIEKHIREGLQRPVESISYTVRIGGSALQPYHVILKIWERAKEYSANRFEFKLSTFSDDEWGGIDTVAKLGHDIDVVAYNSDADMVNGLGNSISVYDSPFRIAVPDSSTLCRFASLEPLQLSGQSIALLSPGVSPSVDAVRGYLKNTVPSVTIVNSGRTMNIQSFERFYREGISMLSLDRWSNVHPGMITIPMNWGFSIPLRLLYSPELTVDVMRFVDAVLQAKQAGAFEAPIS